MCMSLSVTFFAPEAAGDDAAVGGKAGFKAAFSWIFALNTDSLCSLIEHVHSFGSNNRRKHNVEIMVFIVFGERERERDFGLNCFF